MKGIELGTKFTGLGILFISLAAISLWPNFQWVIFAFIMLFVGIPHGAIDHLTSDPEIKRPSLIKFIFKYISLISVYILVWWLTPVVAFALFILMSAYHFGQTHFIHRDGRSALKGILFLSRGVFFLSVILFGDFAYTSEILSTISDISILSPYRLPIILGLLGLTLAIQFFLKVSFNLNDLIDLLILPIALFNAPLMLSFVIYFGFWHAVPSMIEEYNYLKTRPQFGSFTKFGKQLLPFTLISIIGIGLILIFTQERLNNEEMIFAFFVMISVISFPHIIYMDSFLNKTTNTDLN